MHRPRLLGALAAAIVASLVTCAPALALQAGDPDPGFGSNGVAAYPFGSGSAQIDTLAVQPDGKLVLAGTANEANGDPAVLLARLKPDGSLDSSFGTGGSVIKQFDTSATPVSRAHAVLLQPDGKILVGTDGPLVVRFDSSGKLDSSFGSGGVVPAPALADSVAPSIDALALQPDGSILVGGTRPVASVDELVVGRVDSSGKPDPGFGTGGLVQELVRTISHEADVANALYVWPDGKIVVAGFSADPSGQFLFVSRLSGTDGSFDDGFADHGTFLSAPFGDACGALAAANGLAAQPDGKVVVAGLATSGDPGCNPSVGSPSLVLRLTGGGDPDPAFGGGGGLLLTDMPNGPAEWRAVALQPDGKLVLGGIATDGLGKNELSIARIDSSGAFDPAFAAGGRYLSQLGAGGASEIHALALQPDGNIVAAGFASSKAVVVRLLGQAPPPAPPPPGPTTPNTPGPITATLSSLGITPAVFSAADSGPSIAKTVGATVSYQDTTAVTTLFTVFKREKGVRHAHRCMKPKRGRSGRRCTRWVVQGRFTHTDQVGLNSFHFTGRVSGHKLRPGRYRLRGRPRFLGPSAAAVEVPFRIVR